MPNLTSLKICCSNKIKSGIAVAFMCPECGDVYACGNYYLQSHRGFVIIKPKPTICISCQTAGLPAPVLFENFNEIRKYIAFMQRYNLPLLESRNWFNKMELDAVKYGNNLRRSEFYPNA